MSNISSQEDYNKFIMRNFELDTASMWKTLERFKEKLQNIDTIEVGDKIYFDQNGYLQVNKAGIRQSFVRWYNSFNRLDTIDRLLDTISELFKFNDMLQFYSQKYNNYYMLFINICYKLLDLFISVQRGLVCIMKTYEDDVTVSMMLNRLFNKVDREINKLENLPKPVQS